jgi:hypothetical protein
VGHQVSFFVMPADLPDLETAIRATGDVCCIADKSPTCEPVELDTIAFGTPAEPRLRTCFIVQRKDIASVSTRFIKIQGYWLIEGTESPVIEFSPGVFSGTRMTRGRAYFASDLRLRPELQVPSSSAGATECSAGSRRSSHAQPEPACEGVCAGELSMPLEY